MSAAEPAAGITTLASHSPDLCVHPLDRLARLQQRAAGDLVAAVRLLFERVQRLPRLAIGVDDVDVLRDRASFGARLAELKTLVAIDRRVGALHHGHEDLRLWEALLDRR